MAFSIQRTALTMLAAGLAALVAAQDVAAQGEPRAAQPKANSPAPATGTATKAKPSQKKAKSAAADEAKTVDPEVALDQARKALGDGKADLAAKLAGEVLGGANKTPRNTARALAVRGEVHLQKGRVAEALVDLDGALWVTGGLQGAEREAAISARQRAMQQAGLGAQSPSSPPSTPSPSKGAPAPATWAASIPPPPAQAAPAARSASAAPVARSPDVGGTPAEVTAQSQSSGGIGSFFSKIFSGGTGSSQPAVTGAVVPAKPSVSSSEPQRSEAEPKAAGRPAPARIATAVAPKPAIETPRAVTPVVAPATAAAAGAVRIQLAAVRSREEADALARRVKSEHKDAIGARGVAIEEEVYGNMGRFYRVRIGPFASIPDTQSICARIRNGGIDCMAMTAE